MAAPEEPEEAQRRGAGETKRTNGHSLHASSRSSTDTSRLVRVLQAQLTGTTFTGWTSGFACGCAASCATTERKARPRTRRRSSTLAQCLLCGAWAVHVASAHARSASILSKVKPSTGEPDAGNPPVRFGGRGSRNQSALPTPIQIRLPEVLQ